MSDDSGKNEQARARENRSENLDSALNALEDILEGRHVVPDEPKTERPGDDYEPETLPLLDDVVIPGDQGMAPGPDGVDAGGYQDRATPEQRTLDHLPAHDDLIRRLVNELNIITESCIDDALAKAKKELMAKLKNHLEIVLPEILEELERRRDEE